MDDLWFKKICDSYRDGHGTHNGTSMPKFPSDQIQINTTGQCGEGTLKEAFVFYQDCINQFSKLGRPIRADDSLLDFGVGWGRIARFFIKDFSLEKIYGIDVTDEFIKICRETFNSDNFYTTTPFPPSPEIGVKFNYIVGYSVFSHLSEKACYEWMKEFHKITAPGAVLALTTRGRPFFDYCKGLQATNPTGYSLSLSKMFDNFDEAKSRYDKGEFVFSNADGVTGGGAMTPEFYGETFIPKKYAASAYTEFFELVEFDYDESRQSHPIMFFKRKDA